MDANDSQRDVEPVFREPWEAQLFSLVVALQDREVITAHDWSTALGEVIAQARDCGEPDTGENYYQHCLIALENLLLGSGLAEQAEIMALVEDWKAAYLATPHGQPVQLADRKQANAQE